MKPEDTTKLDLFTVIESHLEPLDNLISFSNRDFSEDVMDDFHGVLKALLEHAKNKLEKTCEFITEQIGGIKVYEARGGRLVKVTLDSPPPEQENQT